LLPPAERFRRLPKAELHVHLDGSLRPATLVELAGAARVDLPTTDPGALRRYMRTEDARNLEDYLARFAITVQVLQRPEAIERVAYEMVLDAARDGVRYLEVRYCPALSLAAGLRLDEVIAAEHRGLDRGARETGLRTGIICCSLRHLQPAQSEAIAEAAVRNRGNGVVGFDIAGGEASHPAAPHRHAFEIAARGGLGITVHAGEAAGPASVAEALFDCRANRIGHGTHLIEDPALTAYVRDRGIPVELCLTSNRQTRAVPSLAAHPLRRYLDQGLHVTLCSDNWLMSDVTLSSEYALASATFGLTSKEIRHLVYNAVDGAFLPLPERRALAAEVLAAMEGWT
jgi:adenosine deaminase